MQRVAKADMVVADPKTQSQELLFPGDWNHHKQGSDGNKA